MFIVKDLEEDTNCFTKMEGIYFFDYKISSFFKYMKKFLHVDLKFLFHEESFSTYVCFIIIFLKNLRLDLNEEN